MVVWLNIDKPTRVVTLHAGECSDVLKRDLSVYKPTARDVHSLHRDGGWVQFDDRSAALEGVETYRELRRRSGARHKEIEFRECRRCVEAALHPHSDGGAVRRDLTDPRPPEKGLAPARSRRGKPEDSARPRAGLEVEVSDSDPPPHEAASTDPAAPRSWSGNESYDDTDRPQTMNEPQLRPGIAGEVIAGRYRLIAMHGRGGFSETWRATDLHEDELVALTLSRLDGLGEAFSAVCLLKHPQFQRQMTHPGIVSIRAVGRQDDVLWSVSEWMDGVSMDHWPGRVHRADHRPSDDENGGAEPDADHIEELALLLSQAAAAVGFAHEKGVMHCDIKPRNILCQQNRSHPVGKVARVIFWELAIVYRMALGMSSTDAIPFTARRYTALERHMEGAGPPDPRQDVYSLAAVLRQLLGRTADEPELDAVCRRGLAADPSDRPANGALFAEAIDHAIAARRARRGGMAAASEGQKRASLPEMISSVEAQSPPTPRRPANRSRIEAPSSPRARGESAALNELVTDSDALAPWRSLALGFVSTGLLLLVASLVGPYGRLVGGVGVVAAALVVGLRSRRVAVPTSEPVTIQPLDLEPYGPRQPLGDRPHGFRVDSHRTDHGSSSTTAELLRPARVSGVPSPPLPPLPPAASAPIILLRAHLRAVYGALVPFFQRDDDPTTLNDIYVELALDRLPGRAPDAPRELTLEALMRGGPTHRRHGRWAILGEPGAGKSTLVRHLVWQHAAPNVEPLALYIGVADWAEFAGDPFDYIEAELRDHHGTRAAGLADALRAHAAEDPGDNSERLWLIFDGFDEIAPHRVARSRERLITFAAAHPQLTLAVTSRPIGYHSIAGFTATRVQTLDAPRRRALLTRWLGPTDGDAAFARIEAQTELIDRDGPLAGNPLLLSLLARLAADRPDRALPATRTALFGDAIELLLTRGHSPTRRGLGERIAGARRLLAALALDLTALGGEAWTRATLVERLEACCDTDLRARLAVDWRNADGFLAYTGHHAGILAPHDGAHGRWRFLHRALRVRLAAEALLNEGAGHIAARIRTIADDPVQLGRWGETLGMACAMLDDSTAPLRALQAAGDALTLRVLPELTGLPPRVVLDVLVGLDPNAQDRWDGDTLLTLARRWPVEEAVARLNERVTPALDLDRLAFIHYALTALGHRPERAGFFSRAGRPIERVPPLAMVIVPAGTFRMGSPDGETGRGDDEVPQHRVILTTPYQMGATPVTCAEYAAFDPTHKCPGGNKHPVTNLSWWRAGLYAAWADAALPTEAQWEHACRAGTTTAYWSGDNEADLARVAWYKENSGGEAHAVAQKPANPWGLYDMHGNIWEWCVDWHGTYPAETITDPNGPAHGKARVWRGGSWSIAARSARSAYRYKGPPGDHNQRLGFRLVRLTPKRL